MIRPTALLTFAALFSLPSLACDKPGATERQREEQATQQAAQGRTEAQQQSQNAQAEAEKNIAAARADFEKTREDYRHSRTTDLSDLDKQVAELEAKAEAATGKTKADLDVKLPVIHAQRDAFVRDMQALDRASSATWDQSKANLDREWDALKDAVDKAH
jgi:hypothetical protein